MEKKSNVVLFAIFVVWSLVDNTKTASGVPLLAPDARTLPTCPSNKPITIDHGVGVVASVKVSCPSAITTADADLLVQHDTFKSKCNTSGGTILASFVSYAPAPNTCDPFGYEQFHGQAQSWICCKSTPTTTMGGPSATGTGASTTGILGSGGSGVGR